MADIGLGGEPGCKVGGGRASSGGGAFASAGSVTLTSDEGAFDVSLPGAAGRNARVRLTLDTTKGAPVIDNVAVNASYVPEPSMLAQIGAGVVGLLALARRRA